MNEWMNEWYREERYDIETKSVKHRSSQEYCSGQNICHTENAIQVEIIGPTMTDWYGGSPKECLAVL